MNKHKAKVDDLVKKISKEVLSHLDDEQLKQIAGGATDENPDAENEDSCGITSCNTRAAQIQ